LKELGRYEQKGKDLKLCFFFFFFLSIFNISYGSVTKSELKEQTQVHGSHGSKAEGEDHSSHSGHSREKGHSVANPEKQKGPGQVHVKRVSLVQHGDEGAHGVEEHRSLEVIREELGRESLGL